jgi:gliding motility-associated-like protein
MKNNNTQFQGMISYNSLANQSNSIDKHNSTIMKHNRLSILLPLVIVFLTLAVNIQAQTASFTASTKASCLPATITFTDTSVGATTWNWDFGNNNSSTLQNPKVSYVLPGTYTVTLTINKNLVTEKVTSKTITINPSPYVNPVPTSLLGCEPFSGTFTADAHPQIIAPFSIGASNVGGITGAAITSYTWDFAGALPTVTQASPILNLTNVPAGSYDFLLTATDANGCHTNMFYSSAIIVTAKPVADFTITKTDLCVPGIVNFTNTSTISKGTITSYAWDVNNDGSIEGVTKDFSYNFPVAGKYDVALTVTSDKGCVSVKKIAQVSYNLNNTVDFNYTIACAGMPMSFFDNSTANATKWLWDFNNDGVADSNLQNPNFTFATPGNKTVKLTVEFTDGCIKSTTKMLDVSNNTPSFTADLSGTCPPNYDVQFTSTSSTIAPATITSYGWDFNNDGIIDDVTANPSHPFSTFGTFPVGLTVTNSIGCSKKVTQNVVIGAASIDYMTNRTDGCAPLNINFTRQYTNATDPIVSYSWDFGDPTSGASNTSTLANPNHVYNNSGEYTITLTAVTTRGCLLTQTKKKFIKVGTPPVITLVTYSQVDLCQRNAVKFKATITKDIDKMDWDFGDASPIESHSLDSVLKDSATHKYLKAGTMTVKVTAWSRGCKSITEYIVTPDVVINDPVADFTPSSLLECTIPSGPITFTNKTSGNPLNTTWDWDFGDGTAHDLTKDPVHTYAQGGDYKVKLSATNTVTGCVSDSTYNVFVCQSDPKFTVDNPSPCAADSISFTNQVILNSLPKPGFTVFGYLWDFGDGKTSTKDNPKHAYVLPGKYTVKLTVTEAHGGCATFTHTETDMLTVRGPMVDFTVDQGQICAGSTVNFTNKTKHDPSDTADPTKDIFLWNFGDGQTSTTEHPSHTYAKSGSYTVVLKVTDENGCFSTKSYTNSVIVPAVIAGFSTTRSIYCADNATPIQFTNTATGTITSYDWDLDGDGVYEIVGGTASQSKIFTSVGVFNIKQKVTSNLGCTHDTTKTITIVDGNAGINLTNPGLGCAPVDALFQAKDLPASVASYTWNFGDGLSSNQANPQHRYLRRGDYTVKLTEVLTGGCTKIDSIKIHVPGAFGVFTYDGTPGCTPHTETFHIDDMQSVDSIKLNFGDGNSYYQKVTAGVTSVTVNHTYTSAGSSSPVLILKDSVCGDYSFYDFSKLINTSTAPKPGFTTNAVAGEVCLQSLVQFTDTTKLVDVRYPLSNWDWDFGDGTAHSTSKNPTHIYTKTGTYNVTLTVGNGFIAGGCDTTVTHTIKVNPLPDVSSTKMTQTVISSIADLPIPLQSTLAGTTFSWTRTTPAGIVSSAPTTGNGVIIGGYIPSATFTNTTAAPVTVTYTVTPAGPLPTSCAGASINCDVVVSPNAFPVAVTDSYVTTLDTEINKNVSSNDTPSTDGGNNWGVKINVTQGNLILMSNGSFKYTPNSGYVGADSFTYWMADLNGDTVSTKVNINVVVPDFIFDSSSGQVCKNSPVQFTDKSTLVNTAHATTSWDWDFGDGSAHATVQNPVHVFAKEGTFTTTLTISYNYGSGICTTSKSYPVQVNPTPVVSTTVPTQSVVTGIASTTIPLQTSVAGTTYSWTRTTPAGINTTAPLSATDVAANGEIASAVFNNTTNAPITITYTVIPTAGAPTSCVGVPLNIDVIVLSNKVPKSADDSAQVLEDHVLNGNVSLNDAQSIDGGNVWSVATQASHGTVVVNADGTYIYTPNLNYSGNDSFMYTMTDLNGDKSSSTVYISVLPIPHIYKTASNVKPNNDGTYTLTYTLSVNNTTPQPIDSIQVTDNLEDVFKGSGCSYTVTRIEASGNLTANGLYDGKSIIATLLPGKTLKPGQRDSIIIELHLDPHGKNDSIMLSNQAILNCSSVVGKLSLFSDANLRTSPAEPTLSVVPKTSLTIPDAFSPNKDGINEYFFIQHDETVTVEIEVFNRWGNAVYKRTNYQNDWDGRGEGAFFGQDLPSGTYFITYKTYSIATGGVLDSGIKYITLRR